MARKTRYDEEFKKNTVELLIKSRKSMTQISKDLGVSLNTLINWKQKYLTDDGPFRDALQEKVDRLEKQLAEVTEEREILKKSVAIFLKPRK
ncbi:transposase [Leptospira weilii serovar Ranarum str. ICFT]|uniref:Transposase n=1 Tax=Leptospira weilii serovar Ranarum str. ICFT TaxID=1218598 RepID=N1WG80_9LEPT|nr:transposase [Leptospira weilii]EMY76144.1 transposase [Leptospira weilii serovar Ranarum str. ICFT]